MQKCQKKILFRFPPEPNGYLHLGHAKAIKANFESAKNTKNGECIIRFDDSNPDKISTQYIENIIDNI
jgi:glutaminyl-tRNA synthetase